MFAGKVLLDKVVFIAIIIRRARTMIDQLRTMAIFQTVAELGSFRAAAKRLKLSPSVISHHVTQLEGQLGTPLLYRSTRRISLTDAGAELLSASQRMSAAAVEGLAAVNRRVEQPVGRLSITMNTGSANSPYSDIYTGFAKAYPKIQLSLNITDWNVSLEGSGFDLAIRGSPDGLDDSTYKAKKFCEITFGIFAAPSYVASRDTVKTLDDLAEWDRIQAPPIPWGVLARMPDGTTPKTEPKSVMSCDNFQMGRQFMLKGLGFMVEATALFAEDVKAGRAVQILPTQKLRRLPVYAVYPANAPRDSPARLFVEFMSDIDRWGGRWLQDDGHYKVL